MRALSVPSTVRVVVLGTALLAVTACGPVASAPGATPASADATTWTAGSATASPSGGTALAAVAALAVKGRSARTGYTREQFGQAWFDADRNGCDTRNDVLRRDLVDRTMKNACKVLAGTLHEPYTGRDVHFAVGGGSEVDVDHVVALGDAWVTGAAAWPAAERLALANDPLNLLAADASANRAKGDGDAATWLPPARGFRCAYVARQVAVKLKYGLWVTPAEKAAMVRVLSACPSAALPPPGSSPTQVSLPRNPSMPSGTSPTASGHSPEEVLDGVHAGSYCSPEGALGRTGGGRPMRCRSTAEDPRTRWRRA